MSDYSLDREVRIQPKAAVEGESQLMIRTNQLQWKRFDELKEEYGFGTRAAAARYFLNIGMLSVVDNDPRNEDTNTTGSEDATPTIREYVPEGRENAIDLKDDLPEILRDNMLDIIQEDSKIQRDGFEVWR